MIHACNEDRRGATRGVPGLGLPSARKLVLAHGGDFKIESAPGQGTAVTISLPR